MKTINEIRIENAKNLIADREKGNTSKFADKIESSPSHISNVFSENSKNKRSFGDDLARRVEKVYGLERGFMDNTFHQKPIDIEEFSKHLENVLERDREDNRNTPMKALIQVAFAAYDFSRAEKENDVIGSLLDLARNNSGGTDK